MSYRATGLIGLQIVLVVTFTTTLLILVSPSVAKATSCCASYEVIGAGTKKVNGVYEATKVLRDGVVSYEQRSSSKSSPAHTLLRFRFKKDGPSFWYVSELGQLASVAELGLGDKDYYRITSDAPYPPTAVDFKEKFAGRLGRNPPPRLKCRKTTSCEALESMAKPVASSVPDSSVFSLPSEVLEEYIALGANVKNAVARVGCMSNTTIVNANEIYMPCTMHIVGTFATNVTFSIPHAGDTLSITAKYSLRQRNIQATRFFEVVPPRNDIFLFCNLWNQRSPTMKWISPTQQEFAYAYLSDNNEIIVTRHSHLPQRKSKAYIPTIEKFAIDFETSLTNLHLSYRNWQNAKTNIPTITVSL